MHAEKMTFTKYRDGSVTVDQWPERVLASAAFLSVADSPMVDVAIDGRTVTLTVANGHARYRVIDYEDWSYCYWLQRQEHTLTEGA